MTDVPPPGDDPAAHESGATVGRLVLVSTPIGNLGDMTVRAREALARADVVLCEDTRTTRRLLAALAIEAKLQALHEHNEDAAIPGVLARLRAGGRVALVSDAGTPLMSDPGFRLARAAIAERAAVSATLVWHEAPHRLAETLRGMAEVFGDRPAAVARELTKRFEEVRRGGLVELAAHYAANDARGEVTVVVGPAPEEAADATGLDEALRNALRTQSVRDAAALVAEATGLPRKLVYARALELGGS